MLLKQEVKSSVLKHIQGAAFECVLCFNGHGLQYNLGQIMCYLQLLAGYFGEGNGTPLQYSCLENPMDRGAWWAAVHGVAESQTGLRD